MPVAVTARAGTPLHRVRVTQIAAGGSSACALSTTGAVYCWGACTSGQLGDGSQTSSDVPVTVTATGTPVRQSGDGDSDRRGRLVRLRAVGRNGLLLGRWGAAASSATAPTPAATCRSR